MPSFLIVGAGAIGALIGGMLARADPENSQVVLIARGPHYQAMRANNGLTLHINCGDAKRKRETIFVSNLTIEPALDQVKHVGGFDVILLCVKAHQLQAVALDAAWPRMLNERTVIIPLQNGLPWYLFLARERGKPFAGRRLLVSDPNGALERAFPIQQVVGAVAMPAAHLAAPGVVEHTNMWQLPMSRRAEDFTGGAALIKAGFECPYYADFERELWVKMLGSAMFNPVSALTGATLGEFNSTAQARSFALRGMEEVRQVARSVGVEIPVESERRLRGAARIHSHKTSMLQDVEAGKPGLEYEALLGTVVEIASWTNTPTPILSVVYDLIQMKEVALQRSSKEMARSNI